VSLQAWAGEHRSIDSLAIVAHAQSKLLVVVTDLDLDLPRVRMPEGVAKSFRCNLVDLVAENWMDLSGARLR
jgi:hypothetical protein